MAAASEGAAALLRASLRDRGVWWVLGGWTAFTLENVLLSENRSFIRRSWGGSGGQGAYQGFYSSLSAATLSSTIFAYWRFARFGVQLPGATSLPTSAAAIALRAAGLVGMGQLVPPVNLAAAPLALGIGAPPVELAPAERGAMGCPFDFNAYKERGEVYGIVRVSRRPEICALGAVSLGGALLATTATQVAFFGVGPVLCFIALAAHADRTMQLAGEVSAEKVEQTSVTPFLALLDGRQSWSKLSEEIDPTNAAVGVGLALLMALRPPWMRLVK